MSSPAYNHALSVSHHVFMNLQNEKFYILPENSEVTSPVALRSVQDIVSLLNPCYTTPLELPSTSYDLNHKPYMVGYVGLNNISNTDYSNVIIQLLVHITPIRDFFLTEDVTSLLSVSFRTLVKKLWSSHLYKSHISPHEFLQTVSSESKGQFSFTPQQSPKKFLVWILNQLHKNKMKSGKEIKGNSSEKLAESSGNLTNSSEKLINYSGKLTESSPKLPNSSSNFANPSGKSSSSSSSSPSSSCLSKSLQGSLQVKTIPLVTKQINNKTEFITDTESASITLLKFWILTLDLPPTSLFSQESKINEVELVDLLQKYNGTKTTQTSPNELKTYKLKSLPPYLLLHIDRGLEGNDKRGNPTVVKYPEVLDLEPFLESKNSQSSAKHKLPTKYKLVANIKHSLIMGDDIGHGDDKNQWSISIRRDDEWILISDLEVKKCEGELMFLDENYIQLWKRC